MIPVADLRKWLKAPKADDDILEWLERGAVAFIERHTGRYFGEPEEATVMLNGSGRSVLWLPDAPSKIEEVKITGATILVGDTVQALGPDDYTLSGRQLISRREAWPRGERNITVRYTRGYAEGEAPSDIEQAVLGLVSFRYRGRGSEGVSSRKVGDLAITFTAADMAAVPGLAETLAAWRSAYMG